VTRRLYWLSIPFREPFTTAGGSVKARDIVLLRLEDEAGVVAFGEAAPFEPYDGVPFAEVVLALLHHDFPPPPPPHVHAADEMAFLDLEGRRLGVPLAEPRSPTVAVNYTLAGPTPEAVAEAAAEAASEGYECFKLKVGVADDEARVAAVRDAIGRDALLRLDANAAWSAAEAIERIGRLEPYDIEFVEEPCATLAELAQVRQATDVRIAADESVQTAADVLTAAEAGACDIVSIKLATMGGLSAARAAIHTARESGIEPYVSSSLDGPWGIAASLQLASAEGIRMHCGLATLELFDASLAAALPAPERGRLAVPPGPGLGVDVSEEAIAEVLVHELE
jgi:o-succinylbenzoate synthase